MGPEILQPQPFRPVPFMEIHQHGLLEFCLTVCNSYRVVMPVESVNEGLNAWFVDVANIGCSLSWLLPHHDSVGIDEAKCVNDDFPFDRLDGVDDHCYGTRLQILERLGASIGVRLM
jgi:hypothetical protein